MPSAALAREYDEARIRYVSAVATLVPLAIRMALERLDDVLPGVLEIEVDGRINEDWLPTLRVQRVLNADGGVLFDLGLGHPNPVVEEVIDEVNTEYLDLVLDLTGDDYMGHRTIDATDAEQAP